MCSLEEMNTCSIEKVSEGRKAIKTKSFPTSKKDGKGNKAKHKVRVLTKPFSPIEGFDYIEVFSPVSRYSTVQLLLAL